MYVLDLTREIDFIEKWYANRFREMDAYFGIKESDTEDGITVSEELRVKSEESQQSAVYDLSGRRISNGLKKGIYIINNNKVAVK